ncbi:MAG: sulfatase-like hydrolase/transferase [Nocardioides sp.]
MPLGRTTLPTAALAGAALLTSLVTARPPVGHLESPAPAAAGGPRPNVIVVLTDDMRADELRLLPAVRRLQRSGVTFTRALSADSICCPARATLLTGKLAHNHLTLGNNPSNHGGYSTFAAHNDIRRLLPRWLDHQGYRTAWIGKYLNGFPPSHTSDQPGWSYFAVPVHDIYDYRSSRFAINGRLHTDGRYREIYTRRLLLSRLRDWSSGDRPFFVLYSALAPHKAKPLVVGGNSLPRAQRIHRDFDPSRLAVAPSVGELDVSDKPGWLQDYVARVGPRSYPLALEMHRVEALESVNDTVRHLVATLRDLHEEKRTIVVFTSDNGFMLREHDLADKNKAYDESVHVPLVVRGPGFRGGIRADQTVSLADVTATVRRAAGVTRAHGADGLALQDVLAHPEAFARRPVEIEGSQVQYPHAADLPTDPIGRFYSGAVWGPYSFVSYQTGDHEFYDRSTDPWQLDNAYSAHPAPQSPQALLEAWYAAHVDCQGSACNDPVPTGP